MPKRSLFYYVSLIGTTQTGQPQVGSIKWK